MHKKFLSGLFLMLLFNLLIKPFWVLGIEVGVQNRVGAEIYGLYFTIINTTFLFNILLDFGITNYNNRHIAQNNHLLSKQFSRTIPVKFMMGVLFMVITFFFGFLLGYNHYQFYLLGILCFNQFLSSFILYLRSNLGALLMFKIDSVLSVLDRFLMILFCGILLWGNVIEKPFQIEWFIYSQTAAYLITASTALIIILGKIKYLKFRFNKVFTLMVLKQSIPFAVLVLLMAFYNRIDSVVMLKILGNEEGSYYSGIYASAYRLLDSANMVAYLFSVLLLPIFSQMLKNKENIQKITKLAFSIIFIISVSAAVSLSFQSTSVIDLLYESSKEDSIHVFRILILGFIPISFTYIFGTLLTAGGSLKQLNFMAATGVIINIGMDIVFIPQYKAMGAAWTSLCTQSITALFQLLYAVYYFKIKVDKGFLLKLLIYAVCIILLNMILKAFSCNLICVFAVIAVVSVSLPIILQIINIRSLKEYVKSILK